jgi:hypothetical protein
LKHGVWIESAYGTVVDMTCRKSNGTACQVGLCTTWLPRRGDDRHMHDCVNDKKNNFGFIHPYKLGKQGYKEWSAKHDWLQLP